MTDFPSLSQKGLIMGYTHYWNQKRDLNKAEWVTVVADIRAILAYAQHECGIALAGGAGTGGTSPPNRCRHNHV